MILPEHDPELIVNRRSAERMLEMIRPSPDDPQHPQSSAREDDLPQLRSSHTFIVADDVEGRNDPELSKTFVGSFDQHYKELARLNTHRRCGVFIELDSAEAFVAHFHREPQLAWPVQPSLTLTVYRKPGHTMNLRTFVWLVERPGLSVEDRNTLGLALKHRYLATAVPKGGKALLRVPGFYDRRAEPALVQGEGTRETCGTGSVAYSAEALIEGFLGRAAIESIVKLEEV